MPSLMPGTRHPDIRSRIADVMALYHGELVDAEVTVGLLVAEPNDDGESELKLHGYPCAAIVKINGYAQRVQGLEDACITVDALTWRGLAEDERIALIDHELHHLEVAKDKKGNIKSDKNGRPRLKMRLHDWELGGFAAISGRHGKAALEVQAFHAVSRAYHQQLFRWSSDLAGGEGGGDAGVAVSVPFAGKQVQAG